MLLPLLLLTTVTFSNLLHLSTRPLIRLVTYSSPFLPFSIVLAASVPAHLLQIFPQLSRLTAQWEDTPSNALRGALLRLTGIARKQELIGPSYLARK